MRLAPLLLALPLVLTACSSDPEASPGPSALPTLAAPTGCPTVGATEIPTECVPNQASDGPPPIPVGKYPPTSAEIKPVVLAAAPGDLAAGGNDKDPTLLTRTFDVTVPAGARLSLAAACDGATFLEAKTVPASKAELTISCFDTDGPSELTVSDDVFQPAPKAFKVTITTKAPSRWYVAVGGTMDPLASPAA